MDAAHLTASKATTGLLSALSGGAEGPRFCLAELKALLDRSEQHLLLCKPWLPTKAYQIYQRFVADDRAGLDVAAAAFPGQAMLPVGERPKGQTHTATGVPCSGCGRLAFQLRKCSECRAVSYCSRECQVRHWKEGGHKRECTQLAAAAGAGPSCSSAAT